MEPFAVNEFDVTKALFREGMMEVSGYRRAVTRLLSGFAVTWLVLFALFFAKMTTPGTVVGSLATIALLSLWLAVISRSNEKRFFYEEVSRISESRNLFLLECGDGLNVMVSKSGFSSGSWPEVRTKFLCLRESVK